MTTIVWTTVTNSKIAQLQLVVQMSGNAPLVDVSQNHSNVTPTTIVVISQVRTLEIYTHFLGLGCQIYINNCTVHVFVCLSVPLKTYVLAYYLLLCHHYPSLNSNF